MKLLKATKPVYLVIIVLVGIIIFQRECQRIPESPECPTFDTTGFIASLPIRYADTVVKYKPKPYPVYIDTGSTKIIKETVIPENIDSLAVAMAYYYAYWSHDTILNDTNGLIVVHDFITENAIQSRQVSPKEIYPHFKIVTKTMKEPYKPKFQVYAGVGIGGWSDQFGASGNILFKTKKDHIYGIGFDPINTYAEASIYWKISFRKNK